MFCKNDIRPQNQRLEGDNINNIMGQPSIIMGDTKITDSDLKYTPKSEFINNANVLSDDDVLRISETEKVELLMKLQRQNLEVRKDNEQFRQKNFKMQLELRKLKKEFINSANDDGDNE
jgi:hypothetical protein